MHQARFAALSLAVFSLTVLAAATPPPTETVPVVDTYFKTQVTDTYRWLEDGASPKVEQWNQVQGSYARAWLDGQPHRIALKAKLTELITSTSPSFSGLEPHGSRVFASYFDPAHQQQPVVVTLAPDLNPASKHVVLDPNAMDTSGQTSFDWYVPSHDGALIAVSISKNGSEDGTLHVYEAATGKELADVIPRVQYPTAGGSLAWAADNKSFWYTRYPGEERPEADRHFYMQVFFHKLGQDWKNDGKVLGTEDGVPKIGEIFLDNRDAPDAVVASVQNGDGDEWRHWLIGADGKKVKFADYSDKVVVACLGADHALYLVSRASAPMGKVLKLAAGETTLAKAQTLVAPGTAAITGIVLAPDRPLLYVSAVAGGPNEVRMYGTDGKPAAANGGKLPLPDIATFFNLTPMPGGDLVFGVSTYLRPFYYARRRADSGAIEETALAVQSPVKFDDAEVVREFAQSKDGTRVPVNIIRRKGTKLDGKNPALLYGYGGYGVNQQPHFAGALVRLFLDGGGVYAEANIRGGGEYGEPWHDQGRLLKKQNVFDDFAAAGQYLIRTKHTDSEHLALRGGSNGGLLMGALITQHPQLARTVVSQVGIYDMLRVELDPNGQFNTTEFGTVTDPKQFRALHAYSPYHHLKKGEKYPAVLLTTGANDGRVNPMQSRKFAAALQAATGSGLPVLLRISNKSGHGIGSSLAERIDEAADVLTFLYTQLGMTTTR